MLDACVLSKIRYGTASAWLSKGDLKKLDGFHAKCLRTILRIKPSFYSRVSNERVRELAGQQKLSDSIRAAQIRLLGQVLTLPSKRVLREVAFHTEEVPTTYAWVKRRGRPRQDWTKQLIDIAKEAAGNPEAWQQAKSSPQRWAEIVSSRFV